jgi:hypothetical protein
MKTGFSLVFNTGKLFLFWIWSIWEINVLIHTRAHEHTQHTTHTHTSLYKPFFGFYLFIDKIT